MKAKNCDGGNIKKETAKGESSVAIRVFEKCDGARTCPFLGHRSRCCIPKANGEIGATSNLRRRLSKGRLEPCIGPNSLQDKEKGIANKFIYIPGIECGIRMIPIIFVMNSFEWLSIPSGTLQVLK